MAEHLNPRNPPALDAQASTRGATSEPATGSGPLPAFGCPLAFVVEESDPRAAKAFCDAVIAAVPPGVVIEFLVLDDHTNPERRELVREVDTRGDSARLVPRPEERTAELDAVSLSASSEFIVISSGCSAPWDAVPRALEELWADGSDVVIVAEVSDGAIHSDDASRAYHELARYLGLPGESMREVEDPRTGVATAGSPTIEPAWFVVVRRWVARWLFSEPVSAPDVQHEIAARAGLLGLQMLVLDSRGGPIGPV